MHSSFHRWTTAPLVVTLVCSALLTADAVSAAPDPLTRTDSVGSATGDRSVELVASTGSNSSSTANNGTNASATSTARGQSSTSFTDHTTDDRALKYLLLGALVLVALVALRPASPNDRDSRPTGRRPLRS